jgi:tetratricopeptide (TPR) repeat protein
VTIASILWNSTRVLIGNGDRDRAAGLMKEAEALTSQTQDARLKLFPLRTEALLSTLNGHLEESVEIAGQIVSLGEQLGRSMAGLQYGLQERQRALILLGRAKEALDEFVQAQEIANLSEVSQPVSEAYLLAHAGGIVESRALLEQYLPELPPPPLFVYVQALETALLVKSRASIESLIQHRSNFEGKIGAWVAYAAVDRLIAEGFMAIGEHDEARRYLVSGQRVCAGIRFRPEIALIRLDLAELLLEHYPDERDAAIEHLDFAIAEFREMKMQPSLERALRHRGLLKA